VSTSPLPMILRQALFHPLRTATIDDRQPLTYAKLIAAAFFVAREIRRRTSNPHVGIMLPTSGAFPIALLACWLARRVAVPLNYLLAREELRYVIRDSGIDTVITVDPMLEFIGGRDAIADMVNLMRLEDVKFKGLPPLRWPPRCRRDDLAALLYTSGTSGKPKGVMLTHGNFAANVEDCLKHTGLRGNCTFLGVLPQFHSFGLTALTLLPLAVGARVVYTARFIPQKIVELIRKHRPDLFVGIPSMFGALLAVKSAGPDDFKSIRFAVSGGEALPDAVYEGFLERFSVRILEGYGLTETAPVTHWSTPDHHKRHAVGRSLPRVSTVIVDDEDRPLPNDADGEILLAGPNIMAGYYNLPEETKEAFVTLPERLLSRGGFRTTTAFRTGDIGRVDEDGYLYITGRKKEMLIVGGENVFPREIEEVLNTHEAISASAVIGRRDDTRGEVPVAFVELNDDADFNESAVRNWCRQHLAGYKVPRKINVVEALPRNPTGKILRRALQAD
jgi:long-chain acyl-CoA synthetase